MVLPTRVKFVNETDQRIKLRLGKKDNQIVNLAPGDVFSASGSVNFAFDIEVDIIINPKGPDNNTYLGEFRFNNPAVGSPNVRSDDFRYYEPVTLDAGIYEQKFIRDDTPRYVTWGSVPGELKTTRLQTPFGDLELSKFQGFASAPLFEIKAFSEDIGAKDWDLRITAVPDPLA